MKLCSKTVPLQLSSLTGLCEEAGMLCHLCIKKNKPMCLSEIKSSLERSQGDLMFAAEKTGAYSTDLGCTASACCSWLAVFRDACWRVVLGCFILLLASREVTFWGSYTSKLQLRV